MERELAFDASLSKLFESDVSCSRWRRPNENTIFKDGFPKGEKTTVVSRTPSDFSPINNIMSPKEPVVMGQKNRTCTNPRLNPWFEKGSPLEGRKMKRDKILRGINHQSLGQSFVYRSNDRSGRQTRIPSPRNGTPVPSEEEPYSKMFP
eukprot:scaffold878_cov89-Cylindrotheca_fusiformis.AAC.5